MKKINILIFFCLLLITLTNAQNKIGFNASAGYYLWNSENSLKLVGDKRFRFSFPFGIFYQRDNVFGLDIIFEYEYQSILKDDVLHFIRTSPDSPDPIGYFGIDLTLRSHDVDLDATFKINNYFSYGIGPSFVIVNRIYEPDMDYHPGENAVPGRSMVLYDKLASSGLGLNGFIAFSIPFESGEDYFFFNSKVKIRYTHSIWFDEGIRNLDNYYQEFLTFQITAGVGYSF